MKATPLLLFRTQSRTLRRFLALGSAALLTVGLAAASPAVSSGTAASAALAAKPAAAASWLNPNPSIAVNEFNQQWVFWKGADGDLWEAYNNGSSWRGPIGIPQMGLLGSTPSVALVGVNGTIPYVTWTGNDGDLWYAYDGSGGWVGPCNLGMGPIPVGNRPSIFSQQGSGSVLTIAWKGGDGDLWEAYSTESGSCSGWSGPHNLGQGPLGSVPSAYGPAGGQYLQAVWTGTGPQHLYYYVAGNLYDFGEGSLGSPPSIVGYPYPQHFYVFWAGQDKNLWYAEIDNGGQAPVATSAINLNGGLLGSAPVAAFNGNDTPDGNTWDVVWQGQDDQLWELTSTYLSGTTLHEIPGMGPL